MKLEVKPLKKSLVGGWRVTYNYGGSMKYKVLLFDADDTLFDFKKTEEFALGDALKKIGIDYDREYHLPLYKKVNTGIWKELEEGKIALKKLKTERFRRYFDKLQMEFDHIKFADMYMDSLGDGSFLFDDAKEIVEELGRKTRMAIITNGLSKVQDKRIKKSIISHHFEEIIVSEEVEITKPNPEIFELTMNKINYSDKSSVLMIGDNLASDIQGGINYGIDTCWYNPGSKENDRGIDPTYEVKSLEELKELILNS